MIICPFCGEVNHGRAPDCVRCRRALPAAGAAPAPIQAPAGGVPPTRLGPNIQAGGAAQVPPTVKAPEPLGAGRPQATVFSPQARRNLAGWLVVLRSPTMKPYHDVPLYEGQNALGRGAALGAQRIADERVSENHALIAAVGGQVTLADLGSGNGTTVNRQRVVAPVLLQAGAEIRMGGTTLVFVPFQATP